MAEQKAVRIPESIHQELKELAVKNGVSMGAMIKILIERCGNTK